MSLVIFLIFIFVWYFPVYKKQGQMNRMSKKTVPLTILIGMIPTFIAIILVQIPLGWLLQALSLPDIPRIAFDSFICAALVEELLKFFTAYLILRKVNPQRKVDYVLIFGAVGLGYEVTETLLGLDSMLAGAFRGVFALHIIWQFWMGMYYWEYRNTSASGKNLALTFAVPILFHGLNDFLAFTVENKAAGLDLDLLQSVTDVSALTAEQTEFLVWFGVLFLFMIVEIVFQIATFRRAVRTAKESQIAEKESLD